MSFDITTTREFSAAHSLRMYDGKWEPIHGHNWKVAVTVSADQLDGIGVVMDFHLLEQRVNAIVDPMHNVSLNDLPAFKDANPSAENVASQIGQALSLPTSVRLVSVEVWETSTCRACYRPA